jgi:metal-sulfur cluster biosynthetic enzyme
MIEKNGLDIDVLYNVAMITQAQVVAQLSTVMDPELHIDIVSLGLIYSVTVSRCHIKIAMTLTTPGCPLAPVIDKMVKDAVAKLPGATRADIVVELVWEPAWTVARMSEEAKLKLGMM